jgi:phosphatidate cytidylyltransferase
VIFLTETIKRIISAFFLLFLLIITVYLGSRYCQILIFFIGILFVGELTVNFLLKKFNEKDLYINILLYVVFYGYLYWVINYLSGQTKLIFPNIFIDNLEITKTNVLNNGLIRTVLIFIPALINIILTYFLALKIEIPFSKFFKKTWLVGIWVFLTMNVLNELFYFDNWRKYLILLLLVNFGTDTGAWFFGKLWGKTPLSPTVSPRKTIEGLFGGIFLASLLGNFYWHFNMGSISFLKIILFAAMGFFSQIGDLVQSKIKRQFHLKDSSSLIPGHGGIYDRIDSLIYISPYYLLFLIFYN